jgi:hypothetical protein
VKDKYIIPAEESLHGMKVRIRYLVPDIHATCGTKSTCNPQSKEGNQITCVATTADFDWYRGTYYVENTEVHANDVPVVLDEHLVNARVSVKKCKAKKRGGYADKFHTTRLSTKSNNLEVCKNWAERFAGILRRSCYYTTHTTVTIRCHFEGGQR